MTPCWLLRARGASNVPVKAIERAVDAPKTPGQGGTGPLRLQPLITRYDHETEMYVQCGPWMRLTGESDV